MFHKRCTRCARCVLLEHAVGCMPKHAAAIEDSSLLHFWSLIRLSNFYYPLGSLRTSLLPPPLQTVAGPRPTSLPHFSASTRRRHHSATGLSADAVQILNSRVRPSSMGLLSLHLSVWLSPVRSHIDTPIHIMERKSKCPAKTGHLPLKKLCTSCGWASAFDF